jgi:hypothetical protein
MTIIYLPIPAIDLLARGSDHVVGNLAVTDSCMSSFEAPLGVPVVQLRSLTAILCRVVKRQMGISDLSARSPAPIQ